MLTSSRLRGWRNVAARLGDKPAASVRSEPGSNSQVERFDSGFLAWKLIQGIIYVTGTFTT